MGCRFRITQGESVGVGSATGAGKSTLLQFTNIEIDTLGG
jgi:ABC-type phosphate/phosphonate transport system ATPase subunit